MIDDAVTPPDTLVQLFGASGDLVLIGGQALAFWMVRYGITLPDGVLAVSRDTDFLATSAADRQAVYRLAKAIHGEAIFPPASALTALVGQAIKVTSETERINVDVLFKVHGASEVKVRASALRVDSGPVSFFVMHPLHVLKSRLDNLYSLQEKQREREKSEMQLRCAIRVAQHFLLDVTRASKEDGVRSAALRHINLIDQLAQSDAGRKIAARHGIHVADAIEPGAVNAADFFTIRLPQLMRLMSDGRKSELADIRPS